MKSFRGIALVLVCVGLSWAQTAHQGSKPATYVIAVKDTLMVRVERPIISLKFGPPVNLISGKYDVDNNGIIYVPQVGAIKAEGMTLQQLKDTIVEGLKVYDKSPDVRVTKAEK
jgi:protein involved in polysaccharide export with SLBB domain